jgi:hypothetical protein
MLTFINAWEGVRQKVKGGRLLRWKKLYRNGSVSMLNSQVVS